MEKAKSKTLELTAAENSVLRKVLNRAFGSIVTDNFSGHGEAIYRSKYDHELYFLPDELNEFENLIKKVE